MRIALACLILVAACGKKPAAKSAGSPAPAATSEEKSDMKESSKSSDKDADDSSKSKRSGDPCEGGE